MTVVDASVLVALCDSSDVSHRAAITSLETVSLTITGGTLEEVARTIRRRAKDAGMNGNEAGRQAVRRLLGLENLTQGPAVSFAAVDSIFARHPQLSWVDAWNIAMARALDQPLLTFDQAMARVWLKEKNSP